MSDLKNHYQAILTELENHFQNEDDQAFVLSKFQELSMMFMDVIDRLTYLTDIRIKEVEEKQQEIDNRIETVKKAVDGIENDIYEDDEQDEDYEFEVVCPYCNYEFSVDMDNIEKDEIECPECHNVIELDWNEEHCSGSCSHCMENCVQEDDETYNTNEKDTKKKEDKDNNEDDEDM